MSQENPTVANSNLRARPQVAAVLFLLAFVSYGYFWQSRDWNTATRLMLTYALGDRHQLEIDGLEEQAGQREFNPATRRFEMVAGDLSKFGSHYFTDKAPGQSLLGLPVYAACKLAGLEPHPLNRTAIVYWPSDYLVTLGTSGVLTAALVVVLYAFSLRLGATHVGGVIVGLGYGLGSPAFVYATLFYGHQTAAFCTATSFFLLYRAAHEGRANLWNMLLAGLLAGFAPVVEYQTLGVSAVLGLYAVAAVRRVRAVITFALAAAFAASLLAVYNYRAFGDPLELSYAHEVSREFQAVHSADHPLGLRVPHGDAARAIVTNLVWGRYRGLLAYAPLLVFAPLGLIALLARRFVGVSLVSLGAFAWMLAVNVSYPLWEGGWCTGPRFLVPALPFAFLLVGGLLGGDRSGLSTALSGLVAGVSAFLILACVSVGGRFPPVVRDPLVEIVLPRWRGDAIDQFQVLAGGNRFERNAGRWLIDRFVSPPPGWPGNVGKEVSPFAPRKDAPFREAKGDFLGSVDRPPADPSIWNTLEFAPLLLCWFVLSGVLVAFARRR